MNENDLLRKKNKRLEMAREAAEKLLEEKSRELFYVNQSLEDQVKTRTKDFEIARDEALKASQAKSQFLANMSHEIRTPLNGVIGILDILGLTPLDDRQGGLLKIASDSSELLLSIINDVLDFSKIEAGKMEIKKKNFDLTQMIEKLGGILAHRVFEKGLEFLIYVAEDVPSHFCGDEGKIRQILLNLVGNSIKFTHHGEISIDLFINSKKELQFSIRDTGVGVPVGDLEKVFTAFSQADISDTREYGGSGLGLSISKQIVNAMGGEIWLESVEKAGSCFSFTIPLNEQDKVSSSLSLSKKNQIFLSVSRVSLRGHLCRYLESWGGEVKEGDLGAGILDVTTDRLVIVDEEDFFNEREKWHALSERNISLIVLVTPKRKILDDVDKNIFFINKPVIGRTFFEVLNNRKGPTNKNKKANLASQDNREKRVLLVEDNLVNQQVALSMLEVGGFLCDIANDGREAVELVQRNKYNLILMDCQMPVMDGMEATRQIRALENKKEIQTPIVAMTANAYEDTRQECIKSGMNGFVTKPIKLEVLLSLVEEYVT